MLSAIQKNKTIGELMATLPARFTASDRLTQFPTAISQARIAELLTRGMDSVDGFAQPLIGKVARFDTTDGLRVTGQSGDTIHLRPSGNAPELRCYAESASPEQAWQLTQRVLERCRAWVG
jgi:phosphomannomutase